MLEGLPLTELTASGLLGITVICVLTGRIVPRRVLLDEKLEKTNWKEAYDKEFSARQELQKQNGELLEMARTSTAVLVALGQTSEKLHQGSQGPGGS